MLATPLAEGLFHRAIGESGGCFSPMIYLNEPRGPTRGRKTGETLAAALGCDKAEDPLAALREKTAEETRGGRCQGYHAAAGPGQRRWLGLSTRDSRPLRRRRDRHVPTIVGSNADEGTSLAGAFAPSSVDVFTAVAKRKYGELTDRAMKVYPITSDSDVAPRFCTAFATRCSPGRCAPGLG